MTRGARRVVLALAVGAVLECVACTGSGSRRFDPTRASTATTFPPACETPVRDPARDARAKACGARDDVQNYVRDAQRAILSAWTPPAVDDDASVMLSIQVAADGTLHDVCMLDDFEAPLAPSALEAAERVKQLPKPEPAVAACLPDVRFTALFKAKIETR